MRFGRLFLIIWTLTKCSGLLFHSTARSTRRKRIKLPSTRGKNPKIFDDIVFKHYFFSRADDFKLIAPEGGCTAKCEEQLFCGHVCSKSCHVSSHDDVRCFNICGKQVQKCQQAEKHRCPKTCDSVCSKFCQIIPPKA